MNSLYDIYLGDKSDMRPYRVRSLVRDSAPSIAPRFSTGQQGQTDLDLLKSNALQNMGGGMFQRQFEDNTMVARAIGVYNKYDENVYPTPPRSVASTSSAGYPVAKAESNNVSFLAYGSFSAGTYYNSLVMITPYGGYSTVTMPAALTSNNFGNITGLCIHKRYLYVTSQNYNLQGANIHRYDYASNSWQDISGSTIFSFTIRSNLYVLTVDSVLLSATNETAAGAATYTNLVYVGSTDVNDAPSSVIEFNGAAYISKPSGIYRFDGVTALRVLKLRTTEMREFNGALYFFSGFWLYRFDGTNLVRLQFFGNQEQTGPVQSSGATMGLSSNSDYLFISTVVATSGYSTGDKFGGSASGLRRIYTYDGASFMLLDEQPETLGTAYSAVVLNVYNFVYDFFSNYTVTWSGNYYSYSLANIFSTAGVTTASKLEFTISEFDDNFPNIFKSLEAIETNYSNIVSGDAITVRYQLHDGKTWGNFVTLGTLNSTSENSLEITDFSNKLFKRMKINISVALAAGSTLSIKGASWRHTLQPRTRWRWQTELIAEGNGSIEDRNGTTITDDSNALTNLITQSIKRKTPSFMFAPDYALVKTSYSLSATLFIVKGQVPLYTDPYSEYQLCAVRNAAGTWEIMRVSQVTYAVGPDETTIVVKERGYLGITPGTFNANALFYVCHKVYVNRLLRDSLQLDVGTTAEQASGESQLKRHFTIELVEV